MVTLTNRDVDLDLSKVDALTGATLGKLVRLHCELKENGSRLVLRNVTDNVCEILEVTGLTKVLTIRRGPSLSGKATARSSEVC